MARIDLALLLVCMAPLAAQTPAESAPKFDEVVAATVAEHGADIVTSVVLARAKGAPFFESDVEVWRPAASSIKTAYLIELFDRYADRLDEPIAAIAEILADDAHPAIAHFSAEDRDRCRELLNGRSARDLGVAMIRGTGVPNVVYNAAANVVTALCGGPQVLTAAIRKRHPDAPGFAVRRYMLARRDVTGDNELQAGSLATVWQKLARRKLDGVEPATIDAMLDVLKVEDDHWFKSGALNSKPACRIRSGVFRADAEDPGLVYVVMTAQKPKVEPDDDLPDRLDACAKALVNRLRAATEKGR